jgi:hypothetical protein
MSDSNIQGGTVMIQIAARLRRGTQALAAAAILAAGAVALTSAQPAAAGVGTTGSISAATCGWHAVDGPGGVQYRVTTASLPYVTGVYSTPQKVTLKISYEHAQNGTWQDWRDYYFTTYARYGQWTASWTSVANGRSYTSIDDPLGDSGYSDSNSANPFVGVQVTVYWWNGSQVVGIDSKPETNPNDYTYGQYVCNGGNPYS